MSGQAQSDSGTFVPGKNPAAARLVETPFEAIDSLRAVNPDVLAAFRTKEPDKLADRGEKWNATDIVREEDRLPRSRFVLAGKSSGLWFILYEQGGRRYRQHLMVLTREGEGPWRATEAANGVVREPTMDAFKAALKAGEFTE